MKNRVIFRVTIINQKINMIIKMRDIKYIINNYSV